MLPKITREQLKQYNNQAKQQWIVIDNKVYDVTKYKNIHPGGWESITDQAGGDATRDFDNMGRGHRVDALPIMEGLLVAELHEDEPSVRTKEDYEL
ncbi:cytochrome b5 [Acrasis kona]|uniref:Cytochrome b5 n=1 Tax=Acrasis kona TaxID=1008807 RepID=A0AAW2Z9F7_9EUKA